MREVTLSHLSEEYKAALKYTSELRRAIDCFPDELPSDSPYRYLRKSVAEAILSYLARKGKPATVDELVKELKAGSCIFGAVKSPDEIVGKVIRASAGARMEWMDRGKTQVGLPAWKRKKLLRPKRTELTTQQRRRQQP